MNILCLTSNETRWKNKIFKLQKFLKPLPAVRSETFVSRRTQSSGKAETFVKIVLAGWGTFSRMKKTRSPGGEDFYKRKTFAHRVGMVSTNVKTLLARWGA